MYPIRGPASGRVQEFRKIDLQLLTVLAAAAIFGGIPHTWGRPSNLHAANGGWESSFLRYDVEFTSDVFPKTRLFDFAL